MHQMPKTAAKLACELQPGSRFLHARPRPGVAKMGANKRNNCRKARKLTHTLRAESVSKWYGWKWELGPGAPHRCYEDIMTNSKTMLRNLFMNPVQEPVKRTYRGPSPFQLYTLEKSSLIPHDYWWKLPILLVNNFPYSWLIKKQSVPSIVSNFLECLRGHF